MAESIYKVPTASVGADGKTIFDVFDGTRKLELPEFQQRRLNIDQLTQGVAPTGFTSQFTPIKLDVSKPAPVTALEKTITQTDISNQLAESQASNKAAQDAKTNQINDLLRQTVQKMQLSPEEKAAQARLLGYQQIQEDAIQGAQERPLDGTLLKAGLASEIQNISSGNTRESLVNVRKQTQEAETLNLLTKQREQELAALKLQLDQGNTDYKNIVEAQKLSEEIKNDYFTRIQALNTNARTALATIIDKFKGLTLDKLSPASAAQIGSLAQQSGVPMDVIVEGMKVAKNQLDIENAQKEFQNQTSRINALDNINKSGTFDYNKGVASLQNVVIPVSALNRNGTLASSYNNKALDAGVSPAMSKFMWDAIVDGHSFEEIRQEIIKNGADPKVLDTFVQALQD